MTITKKIETGQPFGLYDEIVDIESDVDTAESDISTLQTRDIALGVLDGVCGATMVVGDAHADTVAVNIQLTDYDGEDIAYAASVLMYLASEATGLAYNTTALTTEVSIGTDGSFALIKDDCLYQLTSEADGDIDITMSYTTGAKDFYVVIVLPNGKLVVSTKLEFQA